MKVCNNCKIIIQDNSKTICPKCDTILPFTYSLYNQEDLVKDISNNKKTLWSISWRVFIMLFSIFGIFGVISGFNIYASVKNLDEKINLLILKEFEKPNITQTIQNVAKEYSTELIENQINPEILNLTHSIERVIVDADSIIMVKSEKFAEKLKQSDEIIDDKLEQIEDSKIEIMNIVEDMNKIKELVKPPTLELLGVEKQKTDTGLKLMIQFKPSKNEPLGLISFKVIILDNAKLQKIYTDPKYGAYTYNKDGQIIDSKVGELEYTLIGAGNPTVIIEVSELCDISIESNYLEESITLTK